MAAALLPAQAQTAASTDKAQERSQQQSDNVYRWIKYFADQQPKKAEPNKARPKAEAPQLAKKPEAKTPAESAQSATAAESAAAPAATPPGADTQQQPAAPQTVAAVVPAAPEPEVTVVAAVPLRPVFVVEPIIPREMRDEVINTKVVLSFTVQQDGSIATPAVVTGSNRRLNRSALEAIAQWRFEPIQTTRATQIEFEFRQE